MKNFIIFYSLFLFSSNGFASIWQFKNSPCNHLFRSSAIASFNDLARQNGESEISVDSVVKLRILRADYFSDLRRVDYDIEDPGFVVDYDLFWDSEVKTRTVIFHIDSNQVCHRLTF